MSSIFRRIAKTGDIEIRVTWWIVVQLENICLWAVRKLALVELAICEQRGERILGSPSLRSRTGYKYLPRLPFSDRFRVADYTTGISSFIPSAPWSSTPDRESSSHRFCPKTYEFRLPTFLTGIASFQDPYLISGWFMGSHRTREDVLHP
jgi:hypothetical protein